MNRTFTARQLARGVGVAAERIIREHDMSQFKPDDEAYDWLKFEIVTAISQAILEAHAEKESTT